MAISQGKGLATANLRGHSPDTATPEPLRGGAFADHHRIAILSGLIIVGAIVRGAGLSRSTLAPDDAWVALTNHYSFSTATHMLVTTPGFTLVEQFWSGLQPASAWWTQSLTFAASSAGIAGSYLLARFFRYPPWVALVAGAIFTISDESVTYATAVKPYAFDALLAMTLLWLAEWARRTPDLARFATLGVASVVCCFVSFSSAVVFLGVLMVLGAANLSDPVRRRYLAVTLLPAGIVIGVIYVEIVRPGVTTALAAFWQNHYLNTTTLGALLNSGLHAIYGLVDLQLGFTPTSPHLGVVGVLYAVLLCATIMIGALRSWRSNAMALSVLLVAATFSALHKIPLGSNRTDGYLLPAMILLAAGGLTSVSTFFRRHGRSLGRVAVVGFVTCIAVLIGLRSFSRPTYPGGDIRPAIDTVNEALRHPDTTVVIEATARYPWAYYADRSATLVRGPSFNTGFSVTSSRPRIIIAAISAAEAADNYASVMPRLDSVTSVTALAYVNSSPTDHLRFRAAMAKACFAMTGQTEVHRYIVSRYHRTSPRCS